MHVFELVHSDLITSLIRFIRYSGQITLNWEPCGCYSHGIKRKLNNGNKNAQTSPQLVPPLLIRWVPKNVAPVTNHDDVINASSGESSVSPAVIGWQSPHPVTS